MVLLCLLKKGMVIFMKIFGTILSEGMAIGKAIISDFDRGTPTFSACEDVKSEKERLSVALATAIKAHQELMASNKDAGKETRDILTAYLFMLKDPDLKTQLFKSIEDLGCSAEWAVKQVFDSMILSLFSCNDPYIKSRGEDLGNVMNRLLDILMDNVRGELPPLTEGSVLLFHSLSPSLLASLDLTKVSGIITCTGGPASHTAIMARAAGIASICCKETDFLAIKNNSPIVIDAVKGIIITNPSEAVIAEYKKLENEQKELLKLEFAYKNKQGATSDGTLVAVEANIGSLKDMPTAVEQGAEGIGLVRTEFLFSGKMPSANEQFDMYKQILSMMKSKPVVFRLLDVGGDKLSEINTLKEDNPFLGYRGIRLINQHRDVISEQIRALLMASQFGDVTILVPMISSINELHTVKKMIAKEKKELIKKQIPFDENIKLGVMMEVPSAVIMADLIAAEVDLMSIGTNDLTQYTLAVDRGNSLVSHLYHNHHPAVLRLIEMVVAAGRHRNIPVCVCGEMASQQGMAEILIGLGVDKVSVNPGVICRVRAKLAKRSMEQSVKLAKAALKCKTSDEVYGLISRSYE